MRKFINCMLSRFFGKQNDCKDAENSSCVEPDYSALFKQDESLSVSPEDRAVVLLETFLLEKVGEAYLASIPELIMPILLEHGSEEHKLRAKNIFEMNSELLESAIFSLDKDSCIWFLELMDFKEVLLYRLLRHPSHKVVIKSIDVAKEMNLELLRDLKRDYLHKMSEYEAVNPEILDHLKVSLRNASV